MAFQELKPTKAATGSKTGVRLSVSERQGLIVALSGSALDALGDPEPGTRVRVLHDPDPAAPLLRVKIDADGPYALALPPGRKAGGEASALMLRIGRQTSFAKVEPMRGLDCTWEPDVRGVIDIDLPREFRAVSQHQPAGNAREAPVKKV